MTTLLSSLSLQVMDCGMLSPMRFTMIFHSYLLFMLLSMHWGRVEGECHSAMFCIILFLTDHTVSNTFLRNKMGYLFVNLLDC